MLGWERTSAGSGVERRVRQPHGFLLFLTMRRDWKEPEGEQRFDGTMGWNPPGPKSAWNTDGCAPGYHLPWVMLIRHQ